MNELEDRLRAELQLAVADLPDQVDVSAALAAGHSALRSRFIRRAAGVTALAVVVALGGWAAVGSLPRAGGLDPMQTVPAVPSSPGAPSDPLEASFDLRNGSSIPEPDYDSIKVAAAPMGSDVAVTMTLAKAGAEPVERRFTMRDELWYVPVGEHLVVGILPDSATWFHVQHDAGKGVGSGQQPLAGIGATAFWVGFEEAGGPGTIRGFVWEREDGVIRDSLGNDVPSARVSVLNRVHLIYRDVALDTLWVSSERGGYGVRLSDVKPSDLVLGGFGAKAEGSDVWEWAQVGSLPPGSRNVEVELAGPGGGWNSATLADGWMVIVAALRTPSTKIDVIRSIRYIDASGKAVEYRR